MTDKFTYRSGEKELLDASDINCSLLFKNLTELDILNRTTGGHAITLKGIKQLVTDHQKTYHVVDIGCGGGGALKAIADWARLNNFKVRLTGVDMNTDAIDYLNIHCAAYNEISGITSDYLDYLKNGEVIDIVHCALFCHHLNDDELSGLFVYFRQHVKTGFVINDLQRQRLAYYGVWFFTRLLRGTKLAKNDGPISVLRGFRSGELIDLLNKANIRDYSIHKEKIFRYLIVGKTNNHEPMAG